jgi:hypothetical protein
VRDHLLGILFRVLREVDIEEAIALVIRMKGQAEKALFVEIGADFGHFKKGSWVDRPRAEIQSLDASRLLVVALFDNEQARAIAGRRRRVHGSPQPRCDHFACQSHGMVLCLMERRE